MSNRHLNPIGLTTLGLAAAADWFAHSAFTVLTVIGVVVSSFCQLGQLWFRWRDSEAGQARLRVQLFREWEAARDRDPSG